MYFSEFLEALESADPNGWVESANNVSPLCLVPVGIDQVIGWVIPNDDKKSSGGIIIPGSVQEQPYACVPIAVSQARTLDANGDPQYPILDEIKFDMDRDKMPKALLYVPMSGNKIIRAGHQFVVLDAKRILCAYELGKFEESLPELAGVKSDPPTAE